MAQLDPSKRELFLLVQATVSIELVARQGDGEGVHQFFSVVVSNFFGMDAIVDDVAASLNTGLQFLQQSAFLQKAHQSALYDPNSVPANPLTIFIPLDDSGIDDHVSFRALWNRHVVHGRVRVGGDGVQQLATMAHLVYAMYKDDAPGLPDGAGFSIASMPIRTFWNVEHNNVTFHGFDGAQLPDLALMNDCSARLAIAYVAYEEVDLSFRDCGFANGEALRYTLVVSLTRKDRTPICTNTKTQWFGNGTSCTVVMPNVTKTESSVMLWFSILDNERRFPIMSTSLKWHLRILPNKLMYSNPVITDVLPKAGVENEQLWILGMGFDENHVRVWVGPESAMVFHCDDRLIRCFVPPGTGVQSVCVANGQVYTRFDSFTYAG